jgi:hypothetical protein
MDNVSVRYNHDGDELQRLATWLEGQRTSATSRLIALDYFRLAARLDELAEQCREFALRNVPPIP